MSVSVIMTCHNEARYIGQAVRSVIQQTRFDAIAEIIVVNDGSTDNSAQVLTELASKIRVLRIMEQPGIGLPAARNYAILQSKGGLIALLDGDDYWCPEKIERQLPAFASSEVGLVYSDFVDFAVDDASDAQFISVRRFFANDSQTLADYFVHDAPIIPSTAIVRRKVFDDVGFFDENLRIGEDTEMFLRIAERWRFQHVSGGLMFKRRHGHNITKRLDVLLPVAGEITQKFAARNPHIAKLAGKRMARRYARAGNDCAQHGDFGLAIRYLSRAIGNDPFFWRPYIYILLAPIPSGLARHMRRWLKTIFHRSRAKSVAAIR